MLAFDRIGGVQARGFLAATTARGFHEVPLPGMSGDRDVKTIVGFTFGGQQAAILGDDLLKYRNPEGPPESLALRGGYQRLTGASQHDQRVRQPGRLSSQREKLLASSGQGRWSES